MCVEVIVCYISVVFLRHNVVQTCKTEICAGRIDWDGGILKVHVGHLEHSYYTDAGGSRCVGRVISGVCDFVCLSVSACVRVLKEKRLDRAINTKLD